MRVLVDADAVLVGRVHELASTLNELTRSAHRLGYVPSRSREVVHECVRLCRRGLPTVAASQMDTPAVVASARQSELVNVRVDEHERAVWEAQADASGFPRASLWVRYLIAGTLDYALPPVRRTVPHGINSIRRDLAGVVTNLAQLRNVAEGWSEAARMEIDTEASDALRLLNDYHRLGGGR